MAVTAAGLFVGTPAAGALSCAPYEGGLEPATFVRDQRLREQFDYTLVGTVLAVRPLGTSARVVFGVAATIERTDPPVTIEVWAHDPMGSPADWFRPGAGWILPLMSRGPEGQPNYSFLCDPRLEVDDPYAVVKQLDPLTIEYGVVFMRPTATPDARPRADDPGRSSSSTASAAAGLGAGVLLGALGVAVLRRR